VEDNFDNHPSQPWPLQPSIELDRGSTESVHTHRRANYSGFEGGDGDSVEVGSTTGGAFRVGGTDRDGWSSITGALGAGFVASGAEIETGMGVGPVVSVAVSSFGAISGISLGFNAI
jgi:hypothetical protein